MPDQLFRIHVLGGSIPPVLVEPHRLARVSVPFHDLPVQQNPLKVQHLRIGRIFGRVLQAERVGAVDIEIGRSTRFIHGLEKGQVIHRTPLAWLGMRLT